MLVEFMERNRRITKDEGRLLEFLIEKSSLEVPENWKDILVVSPMDDGGMGSLSLSLPPYDSENHSFGREVSTCNFLDSDGVLVIASLYLDENDRLFELDMWKVDFQPLLKIPDKFNENEWEKT